MRSRLSGICRMTAELKLAARVADSLPDEARRSRGEPVIQRQGLHFQTYRVGPESLSDQMLARNEDIVNLHADLFGQVAPSYFAHHLEISFNHWIEPGAKLALGLEPLEVSRLRIYERGGMVLLEVPDDERQPLAPVQRENFGHGRIQRPTCLREACGRGIPVRLQRSLVFTAPARKFRICQCCEGSFGCVQLLIDSESLRVECGF